MDTLNFQKGIVYAALAALFVNGLSAQQANATTEDTQQAEAVVEETVGITEQAEVAQQQIIEETAIVEEQQLVEEAGQTGAEFVEDVQPLVEAPIVLAPSMDMPQQSVATPQPQHITTNATYMDALTEQETIHTYTFHVTGKTKVTWQYKHVQQAQWHHTLYDDSQNVIGSKVINSSSHGLFTTYDKILTPGTYYMTITGNAVAMNEHYTFTLTEVLPKMFDDVGEDQPYRDEIGAIQQMGIVTGFENNTFEPDTFIQRKHIAAMIMRAEANIQLLSSPENFADVPYGHPYYQDIMGLYRSNIIDGKLLEDGVYFEPDAQITRAQLAKVLVNAFTIQRVDHTSYYTDVTHDKWFYDAANTLASHGIFFDNTQTFDGDAFVTRAEFAHFLYRAMHVTQ